MVIVGDDGLAALDLLDDGTGSSNAAFSALVPLVVTPLTWLPPSARHLLPASSPWAASSHVGSPLERPPRKPLS